MVRYSFIVRDLHPLSLAGLPTLPIKTFEQKLQLTRTTTPRRHYVYAKKNAPGDVFRQFADRARSEAGWTYDEIDASHNPHITCPDVLMALLSRIMAGK